MQVRLVKELYGNQIKEIHCSLTYHLILFAIADFGWLVDFSVLCYAFVFCFWYIICITSWCTKNISSLSGFYNFGDYILFVAQMGCISRLISLKRVTFDLSSLLLLLIGQYLKLGNHKLATFYIHLMDKCIWYYPLLFISVITW